MSAPFLDPIVEEVDREECTLRTEIEREAVCIEAIAEQLGLPEDASRDKIQDAIAQLKRSEKMKVSIYSDERYPDYGFYESDKPWAVEVPVSTIQRWRRVKAAYDQMQEEMSDVERKERS